MANTRTNKQQLQHKHTNNTAINKTLDLGLKVNSRLAK